jgi:hypothetical protein
VNAVGESKYAPLSNYLNGVGGAEWRATFAEVENVLGFPLPESAHSYTAWWANNLNDGRHCMAWLCVGWRTEELDLGSQRVVFRRVSSPVNAISHEAPKAQPKPMLPPEQHGDILRCEVEMTWTTIGTVSMDPAGKLACPAVTTNPAIYEFRLRYPDGRQSRYVGETVNLKQRFSGYRNAAEGQQTNIRLQDVFKKALAAEAEIIIRAVVENPWMVDATGRRQVVLSSTSVRRLLENAAILTGGGSEIGGLNQAN